MWPVRLMNEPGTVPRAFCYARCRAEQHCLVSKRDVTVPPRKNEICPARDNLVSEVRPACNDQSSPQYGDNWNGNDCALPAASCAGLCRYTCRKPGQCF